LGAISACRGSDLAASTSTAYAYITSADAAGRAVPGAVYQYAIAADGSLTPLSEASVPAGVAPTAMVADPAGRHVYVANSHDGTISQFGVGAGGALLALSPASVSIAGPFAAPAGYSLSTDPKGRFLYVVIRPHDPPGPVAAVAQYSIGNDGTPTPLVPAYVNVPASASGALAIDAAGQHAYLAGDAAAGGLVFQFSIGSDGALVPLEPASAPATATAVALAIAPGGQALYVLSACVNNVCDGQVAEFTIGSSGTVAPTSTTILTGSHVNPVAMLMDGSGSSAYLLANYMGVDTNAGAVFQYAIDSSGALAPYSPASLPVSSGAVAESVYGANLYALSAHAVGFASGSPAGGNVDHYAIGSDGRLTALSTTVVAASLPTAMTVVARTN
jgi:6-phosphogluconolactonase (cycloisomerase 2 family)